jgi:MerR family transcriptional regulator, aldehyde-responsive regulator
MTIAKVTEKYNIPEDTLRYYERIGLLPPVHRGKGGIRDYTEEDCRWVEFVRCMRGAGLSIEVLIEYLRLYQLGDETIDARKNLLVEQRAQLRAKLEEMKQTLERLDYKIVHYEKITLDKKVENPSCVRVP